MEFVSQAWWIFCFRWLHVLSGIMWIGHLYYFNFTQTPIVPKIPAELRPAVPRFIMPEALWWFRWGAMSTIVFGLLLAIMQGYFWQAVSIGFSDHDAFHAAIGIGMWFGTIMWANVWFIIWPNQQKLIGLKPINEPDRPRIARVAGLASRVNTMLSIPLVYCMLGVHFYS